MKTIAATQFKAHCLRLLDEVEATRQPLTITKRGRPVARLLPAASNGSRKGDWFLGRLRGKIRITGDLLAPLGDKWESEH